MKKIFSFIATFITLLINFTAGAQQGRAADRSLLWQISGKGLAKPSYLFGTIHIICKDDYLWTERMKKSLALSDKVCFEMDMDDPNTMMQAAAGLMDHSGKKLKDRFTPEQYKLLRNYVRDSMDMDIALFEGMKPVALQTLLATRSAVCTDNVSYEDLIMKDALKDKKEILGLEDPQEQIAALESIPEDSVIKELLEAITTTNTGSDAEYHQLIDAYKNQDIAALHTLITESKEIGEDMGVFLDDRNKKWIARMEDKMKPSSTFFAVGAGHLWGINGVINLLRAQGYKVEPLK